MLSFLSIPRTGITRFIVLHFIAFHRCDFYKLKARSTSPPPLPTKRLQLTLLWWPAAEPTLSARYACTVKVGLLLPLQFVIFEEVKLHCGALYHLENYISDFIFFSIKCGVEIRSERDIFHD